MSLELLSVCIPTRNRAKYLRDLLEAFSRQVVADQLSSADIAFYISDNASDDETPQVIEEFVRRVPQTKYVRNPANIGGDQNILKVRGYAQGQYVWVLGDDELLGDQALTKLVRLLREQKPGLVISYAPSYEGELPKPQRFADYQAFARECIRLNPHAMAFHSLISSNIYRADCFDFEFAAANLQTCMAQLYGMMRPLLRQRGSVVLPDFPIILMREVLAAAVDGIWVSNLDQIWVNYFTWLREEMRMPELDPNGPAEFARRSLLLRLRRHPLRVLQKNWRSLFHPGAYRFILNRLFARGR